MSKQHECSFHRVFGLVSDRRFCGIVLFCPPLAIAWRADVRRVAVDCLRLTDQCIAGDSRKYSGLCRSRMDHLAQNER